MRIFHKKQSTKRFYAQTFFEHQIIFFEFFHFSYKNIIHNKIILFDAALLVEKSTIQGVMLNKVLNNYGLRCNNFSTNEFLTCNSFIYPEFHSVSIFNIPHKSLLSSYIQFYHFSLSFHEYSCSTNYFQQIITNLIFQIKIYT